MKTRRFLAFCVLIVIAFSALAQTPEAIRESLCKYPNLSVPVASTYPSIPLGEIAPAPEGFEPFYFSLVGRHGSRYEQSDTKFRKVCDVFNKAHELDILTSEGEALRERLNKILKAQSGRDGELSSIGYGQWRAIGHRAYKNFGSIFDGGSIEAKSSVKLRCVLSMVAFNEGVKECNPNIRVRQDAREMDLWMIRPLANDPSVPSEAKQISKEYSRHGEWNKARKEWGSQSDVSQFISKITTDKERFVNECGAKSEFRVARYAFFTLLFAENFGEGDREMLTRLFTLEEMYRVYVYHTAMWVNNSIGRGHEIVEMRESYMRPMVEDIIDRAEEAIAGKNPDVANLRFTHDSYVGPLLSVMGYTGCTPTHNDDIELATTSFNHGKCVPMAANLQLILYRDRSGKVYVRSLINERDATMPIKCKTAPFYPWGVFCNYVKGNMELLDKSQKQVLKKYNSNGSRE